MLVELGNPNPVRTENSPVVTYINIPATYTYEVADSASELAGNIALELGGSPDGITRLPGQEAMLSVVAAWRAESGGAPTWVWSDNDDFAVLLSNFFRCPIGRPDDLEATHFTDSGIPGVGPDDVEIIDAVDPFPATDEPEATP